MSVTAKVQERSMSPLMGDIPYALPPVDSDLPFVRIEPAVGQKAKQHIGKDDLILPGTAAGRQIMFF